MMNKAPEINNTLCGWNLNKKKSFLGSNNLDNGIN